jgi:HNH endonuclease
MGPRASNWRGGRQIMRNGYVLITLSPDDPYVEMANAKRHRAIYEHRYVMAQCLGRCLTTDEQVHHRNGNKQDNRIENLELIGIREHSARHRREIMDLRQRVQELEVEVVALKAVAHDHKEANPY